MSATTLANAYLTGWSAQAKADADKEITEKATTPATTAQNSGMWGGIATSAAAIFQTATGTLNPKVRENNRAIAEANAREAEANAQAQTVSAFDPKYIIIGVIVLVLVIALLMKAKSN
jgi:hypothetical protein